MARRGSDGRKRTVKKPEAPAKRKETAEASPGREARRSRHGKRDGRRERETRRILEEASRLAYSDASKTYRADIWRYGVGHLADMRPVPTPLFAGFGGGGPGSGSLVGAQWTQIGPAPLRWTFLSGPGSVAGRVYDIVIDPSGASDQTIFLATLGGIWKSVDGGASWAPKTDRLPWNQMRAVAIDPASPSIIYAGAIFSPGPSLFRSIDGGETWTVVGVQALLGQEVVRIVVPSPGVVLLTTFINGLFRSIDGGVSFGNNAPLYNNNAAILSGLGSEVHLDTATPTKVYACIGGQGIFVSTDSGSTFPTNLFSNPGAPAPGTYNTVTMAQSTLPDGQTLYASVSANFTTYVGLYKSTNGGASWAVQAGAAPVAAASSQFGFTQTVGVDPQDATRVYLGFEHLWLSTDGATSFGAAPVTGGKVHPDHHAVTFSPKTHWGAAPTRVYVGTDGGFAASLDGGTTWNNLNEGVATLLVGQAALDIGRRSAASNQYSYIGTQDNGTDIRSPGLAATDWQFSLGGDGSQVVVDPSDPLKAYGAVNYVYQHTSTAGASWMGAGGPTASVDSLAVDPSGGANVYAAAGTAGVWPDLLQSADTGDNFSRIHTFPSGITCITVDPRTSDRVWVGLDDGTIWRTNDALAGAGSTWNSYSTGLPIGRSAMSIAVDPFNSSRVVAGYRGFSTLPAPNRSQHVYLTTNDGANWNDVSGTDGGPATSNLPDRPIYAVALDPGSTNGLFGIVWSGTLLVVVGLNGTVLTSPDGFNFTAQASNGYDTLAAVTWTGTQFVAVGLGGCILTSPDGVAWTARKSGPSWEALQGIAWSGTLLVVTSASYGTIYTSPDGVTWAQNTAAAPQALLDIVWNGTQFVAVGYGGTIVTSPDGLIWTQRVSPTTSDLVAIIWAGSQFVASGLGGTIITSPDGVTWVARTSPTANEINGLAFSGGKIVGVVNTGEVVTSTDGISWVIQNSATFNRLIDVVWMGSKFVAVGDRGTVVTSPDGITWTDNSFGEAPFALIASNDVTVLRSIDSGATWQILGVGLPNSPCLALALDWTRTPSLLRVGTNGRSVFELTTAPAARVSVISNLAFDRIIVGSSATLAAKVYNVGSAPLIVTGFARSSGSTAFTSTGLALPMTIAPGGEADFSLRFQPTLAGNVVAVFQLTSTDALTPTASVPMSGIGIGSGTITHTPRFAFVTNGGSNNVSAFTINATTGALASVPGSPFPAGTTPDSVSADPAGKFAFVADYSFSNNVYAFSVDPTTGALTAVVGSPFTAGSSPYSVTVDPSGRFAFVTNGGSNNVSAFAIDATTGALTSVPGSPFASGTTPTSISVDPSGRLAFVANGRSNNVSAFTIDATTGALTTVPGSPFAAGSFPFSVTVDPSGKFVFVANQSSNNISAFAINATTGALTPVRGSPFAAGTTPESVAVDPFGKFAFVANFSSGNVSVFTINGTTGALTGVVGSPFAAGSGPIFVTADPSGKFVFVANQNSNNVSGFSINATTGALTLVAGSPFAAGINPSSVTTI